MAPSLALAPDPVAFSLFVVADHAVAVGVDVDSHVEDVQLDRQLVEHPPRVVDVVDDSCIGAWFVGHDRHQPLVGERSRYRVAGGERYRCVGLDVANLDAVRALDQHDRAVALVELKAGTGAAGPNEPQLGHLDSAPFGTREWSPERRQRASMRDQPSRPRRKICPDTARSTHAAASRADDAEALSDILTEPEAARWW